MNTKSKIMRRVVEYTSCPDCDCWSIGVQGNGRIVRHSIAFGYVEKVGPGTCHPNWRTTICKGSGKFVGLTDGKIKLEKRLKNAKVE